MWKLQAHAARGLFLVNSLRQWFPHPTQVEVNSLWKKPMGPRDVPAEITRARLRTRPMVIAPILHVSLRSATRPSESVGAVLVKFFQVSLELGLECFLEVIALIKETSTKADIFFLTHPSDQLQLPFMFGTILAFTVLIVPVSAEFFMCRPILLLTFDALKTTDRRSKF